MGLLLLLLLLLLALQREVQGAPALGLFRCLSGCLVMASLRYTFVHACMCAPHASVEWLLRVQNDSCVTRVHVGTHVLLTFLISSSVASGPFSMPRT